MACEGLSIYDAIKWIHCKFMTFLQSDDLILFCANPAIFVVHPDRFTIRQLSISVTVIKFPPHCLNKVMGCVRKYHSLCKIQIYGHRDQLEKHNPSVRSGKKCRALSVRVSCYILRMLSDDVWIFSITS